MQATFLAVVVPTSFFLLTGVARAQVVATLDDSQSASNGAAPGVLPASRHEGASSRPDKSPSELGDAGSLRKTAASETPRLAFLHTAFGVTSGTIGGAGIGQARGGFGGEDEKALGGGLRIWGSPIDRLTLLADVEQREKTGEMAPSVTGQLRMLGSRADGWALGGLGRYKAEGFAELAGEVELGLLGSFGRDHSHLDINTIVGFGIEENESDGELVLRAGYDVLDFLRLGAEGRGRYRLSGGEELPGGRTWDAFAGPQVLGYRGAFFGAVTGGISTVGIESSVGWMALATAGGAAF